MAVEQETACVRKTGIRGAWCASDWRLWLLSITHFSDLHGVLSVVFLQHVELLVTVWTRNGCNVCCTERSREQWKNTCICYLCYKGFSLLQVIQQHFCDSQCDDSILVARSRPDTILSHLLLFSLPTTWHSHPTSGMILSHKSV